MGWRCLILVAPLLLDGERTPTRGLLGVRSDGSAVLGDGKCGLAIMVGRRQGVKWPNRIHSRVDAYPPCGARGYSSCDFLVCPPIVTHGSGVDLPRTWYAGPMPRAVREDALSVPVTRDGKIYFRNVPISAKDLPDKIREGLKNGAEKKVYLRADTRARYGDVKQALIEIRQAGIENVCFLTEKLQP